MPKPPSRGPVFRSPSKWRPFDKAEAEALGLEFHIPKAAEEVVGVALTESAWLEVHLDSEWVAAFRMVARGGQPVVAEVRIFPTGSERRSAGEWPGEYIGNRATVPRGGITRRVLKQVRLTDYGKEWERIVNWIRRSHGSSIFKSQGLLGHPGFKEPVQPKSARGRPARPDAFYARVARAYVEAFKAQHRKPVTGAAKACRLPPAQARDALHRARRLGLLTPTEKAGQAGGELTKKAKKLLRTRPRRHKRARR